MRSNLLSLQNISGQVSSTQNKLATGNKVNSAIDNPSSYYTARSLNNRADDLNALLDSMGQAVSTIKAATTALESATEFLEQASAVATQALETAKIPSKSFFEEKVGENGAVVTTAQELRDAINSGKETICVYGAIDLGDISTTGGLELKENQKLVGVGYFGNYDTDTNKFSSITATANVANKNVISITQNNNIVSDLSLKYTNDAITGSSNALYLNGGGAAKQNQAILKNLDIEADFSSDSSNTSIRSSIFAENDANVKISGKITINASGKLGYGLRVLGSALNISSDSKMDVSILGYNGRGIDISSSKSNILGKIEISTFDTYGCGIYVSGKDAISNIGQSSQINIKTKGQHGNGITATFNAMINIETGANISIETEGAFGYGLYSGNEAIISIERNSNIRIKTTGSGASGIWVANHGTANISGNLFIDILNGRAIVNYQVYGGSNTYVSSTAQICCANTNTFFLNCFEMGDGPNILDIAEGARIAIEKDGKTDWYEVKEKYYNESDTSTSDHITTGNLHDKLNLENTPAWELPEKVEIGFEEGNSNGETTKQDLADAGKNYQEIINQYDSLIKDASYKGINLLQADKLTVKFNETNTADLSVQGKDMSSQALGFKVFGWETQGDIADSLAEIASALQSIRNYSSELGNNYSIITTRQDFTESLVNVLTEGADKLTLADMNEESANMLALQTRQQLAINSLSLASQASQSILKLF